MPLPVALALPPAGGARWVPLAASCLPAAPSWLVAQFPAPLKTLALPRRGRRLKAPTLRAEGDNQGRGELRDKPERAERKQRHSKWHPPSRPRPRQERRGVPQATKWGNRLSERVARGQSSPGRRTDKGGRARDDVSRASGGGPYGCGAAPQLPVAQDPRRGHRAGGAGARRWRLVPLPAARREHHDGHGHRDRAEGACVGAALGGSDVGREHPAAGFRQPGRRQREVRRGQRHAAFRHRDPAAPGRRPAQRHGDEHPARPDGARAQLREAERRQDRAEVRAVQLGLRVRRCRLHDPHGRGHDGHQDRPPPDRGLLRVQEDRERGQRRGRVPGGAGARHQGAPRPAGRAADAERRAGARLCAGQARLRRRQRHRADGPPAGLPGLAVLEGQQQRRAAEPDEGLPGAVGGDVVADRGPGSGLAERAVRPGTRHPADTGGAVALPDGAARAVHAGPQPRPAGAARRRPALRGDPRRRHGGGGPGRLVGQRGGRGRRQVPRHRHPFARRYAHRFGAHLPRQDRRCRHLRQSLMN
ncbi:hypothetical protein SBRY_30018 [Actinacidiphila bryophytorum]|uniref:Uncharacterized protein n=1 Tax=Actinacidiphila bryophytorum TaxID=1436133 RepID=A0A9W4MAS1_9ACTN|nr:hypothetical protein SBRY_30018 [Actinacidiphila bryophytorum]